MILSWSCLFLWNVGELTWTLSSFVLGSTTFGSVLVEHCTIFPSSGTKSFCIFFFAWWVFFAFATGNTQSLTVSLICASPAFLFSPSPLAMVAGVEALWMLLSIVNFCERTPKILTLSDAFACFLDEKWFCVTDERQKMKSLPLGKDEAPGSDFMLGGCKRTVFPRI